MGGEDADKPLRERTALVTGGSRGIGRTIAEHLAVSGARVVVTSRKLSALDEVAAALPGEGHLAVAMDLADADATATGIETILERTGGVDILIANAGIAESKPYRNTDDAMWERMMAVNATGVMRLCRALLPRMAKAGWGRAVIVASNAGLTGYAYSSAYCASKHAVLGYMRAVALEIAKTPVTINAVCPGWVDTDMAREAVQRIADTTGKSAEEARSALERMSPQRRWVEPEEVAAVVAMLCSHEARSIHGQALAIDGGQTMR
jgi:NAD(P)-dependent dehydrogenase (short-subunit alcohol dehydrogenase family)